MSAGAVTTGAGAVTTTAELLHCPLCGMLNARPVVREAPLRCARCASPLYRRKPHSLARAWSLIMAAYALYIPANLLPVLETGTLGRSQWDTIMSGVVHLWQDRAWPLAVVILVASIGVPLAKLVCLTYLLAAVQYGEIRHRGRRTRLYRTLELIGRWSMVDIYVGALLVGLVQFEPFAVVRPGPGAIAFGAVVVLTMLASRSFDPRLIWDVGASQAAPLQKTREGARG